jgi:FtsP/CotA-like multicopper oxidase with cupredoxin domain
LNVRLNDKVRIRIGNLTMTNHPIHLHGHEFQVTGTDGGPTPQKQPLARSHYRCGRWPDAANRVCGRRRRRLGHFIATKATTP